ncbi:hypothetical protein ACFQXA_17510 [Nocardiopsis composta]
MRGSAQGSARTDPESAMADLRVALAALTEEFGPTGGAAPEDA